MASRGFALFGVAYGFAAGVFCEGSAGLFRIFLGGCAVCFWGLVPALFPGAAFAIFLEVKRAGASGAAAGECGGGAAA